MTFVPPSDLRTALEPIEKIRKAVGDRMDIMVEFHSLRDVPSAIKIARVLEPYDTFWH
jgi:galactonate dehydratase